MCILGEVTFEIPLEFIIRAKVDSLNFGLSILKAVCIVFYIFLLLNPFFVMFTHNHFQILLVSRIQIRKAVEIIECFLPFIKLHAIVWLIGQLYVVLLGLELFYPFEFY